MGYYLFLKNELYLFPVLYFYTLFCNSPWTSYILKWASSSYCLVCNRTGNICYCFTTILLILSIECLGTSQSSIIWSGGPVLTIFLALLFLDEHLNLIQWIDDCTLNIIDIMITTFLKIILNFNKIKPIIKTHWPMKNHHVNRTSQLRIKKLLLSLFKSDKPHEPSDCNQHRYFSALTVVHLSRFVTTIDWNIWPHLYGNLRLYLKRCNFIFFLRTTWF